MFCQLENRRKERIACAIVGLQAWCRWYAQQRRYRTLHNEWTATLIIQTALRERIRLQRWPWYQVWTRVREWIPLARERARLAELETENAALAMVGGHGYGKVLSPHNFSPKW